MDKDILKDVFLPPMPEALTRVREELAKADPDADQVARIIAGDVTLTGEVLKVVNAPAFQRSQKISSVSAAIMILGLKNVLTLANGVAVRASVESNCKRSLGRFWDSAADVAVVSASLASELTGLPPDTVYVLGLMHDCGVPILMCQNDAYADFIAEAQRSYAGSDLLRAERDSFGFNHALVGAHLAKSWYMPKEVLLAIAYHHSFLDLVASDKPPVGDSVISMIGILKMAENVSHTYRGLVFQRSEPDLEWEAVGETVLGYFGYAQNDYEERKNRYLDLLGER